MLFADYSVGEWIGLIAGGVTSISIAIFGAYQLYRRIKTAANEADGKSQRAAKEEEMSIDSKALFKIIDDLRGQNTKMQDYVGTLQNSALVKIIEAHDEHHKCEKKYAALEVKFQNMEECADRERERADTLEKRIKSLEGRK